MKDIETPGQKEFIGSLARHRLESGRSSWHVADETVFFPRNISDFDDIEYIADNYLFNDYYPSQPVFAPDSKLITMGSCFADRLRRWLSSRGKLAENVDVPPGLNNSFAVSQFIHWIYTGERAHGAYWYDKDKDGPVKWEAKDEHAIYYDAYTRSSGLVITLGLSEVWRDRATGGVFWRGVPETLFDPALHECVISSVDDNAENLRSIIRVVREHMGAIPIIYTLSPVPLNATMRGISPIVGDCISKSTLRVAIDTVMRENHEQVYYWPSFEFIRWVGAHTPFATFGADNTPRHPANAAVQIIIDRFIRAFFGNEEANAGGGAEASIGAQS